MRCSDVGLRWFGIVQSRIIDTGSATPKNLLRKTIDDQPGDSSYEEIIRAGVRTSREITHALELTAR